jgi:hypothetical protein
MNAGGNRSGTRFTPRMVDAATQTYLYGSSDPTPWKANHRMGAAGGGLRDSHLLRGGARETYQRVAGIYERTGDDTVTVESDDHGDDHDLYDQGDGDHGDDQGNSAHGYSDEDPGYDQVP